MKLMTLNLNTYQEENQRQKFYDIAKKIVDEDIDVCTFSEAAQSIMSPHIDDYIRQDNAIKIICDEVNRLLGDTVYSYHWQLVHYGFKIYEEGVAVMSKHPVKCIEGRYVSHTSDIFTFKSRKILKAVIEYNGELVDVYSVQLGWLDDVYEPFKDQFDALHNWIKESDEGHWIILAGDFCNDVRTSAYHHIDALYHDQYLLGNREGMFDETFLYPMGFPSNSADLPLRLDYVFSNRKDIPVIQAMRFFNHEDAVSDHMAVFIEWAK